MGKSIAVMRAPLLCDVYAAGLVAQHLQGTRYVASKMTRAGLKAAGVTWNESQ